MQFYRTTKCFVVKKKDVNYERLAKGGIAMVMSDPSSSRFWRQIICNDRICYKVS